MMNISTFTGSKGQSKMRTDENDYGGDGGAYDGHVDDGREHGPIQDKG